MATYGTSLYGSSAYGTGSPGAPYVPSDGNPAKDVTERVVLGLSARRMVAAYRSTGAKADLSIGGMPFQFAITDNQPYVRETLDYRRQQIDSSREPGEQTLSQWWVRDQDSWHRGAGAPWYEPGSDESSRYRFHTSAGVDVWKQGEMSLLPAMTPLVSSASGDCWVQSAVVSGQGVVFAAVNGVLHRNTGSVDATYTSPALVGSRPVIAGGKVLVGSGSGIMSGDVGGSALSALWTSSSTATPWWVKSRIIAAVGRDLHELTLAGGNLDTHTALWTHPSPTWTWAAVCEAPGAILAAGRDGGYGAIYRFALESSGGSTPVLGAAVQVASFPPGEEVYAMDVYLGTYLAVGTTHGVRLGAVDSAGEVTYGPLVIETTYPVRSLASRDRFIHAGIERDIDGKSGCARIDLGQEIPGPQGQTGTWRYAWAYDVEIPSPVAIPSIAFLGSTDRVVLGTSGAGVYIASTTDYVPYGYVLSGGIRFATTEAKQFQMLRLRCSTPSTATVAVSTIDSGGSEVTAYTLGQQWNPDADLVLQTVSDRALEHIKVRLTLTRSTDGKSTPVVRSMAVKALPAPRVQRTISVPLNLTDIEEASNRVKYGRRGDALIRLLELEDLEQTRRVVLVQDHTSGEAFTAQIKSVRFVRTTPPTRGEGNFGGRLVVDLVRM